MVLRLPKMLKLVSILILLVSVGFGKDESWIDIKCATSNGIPIVKLTVHFQSADMKHKVLMCSTNLVDWKRVDSIPVGQDKKEALFIMERIDHGMFFRVEEEKDRDEEAKEDDILSLDVKKPP